MPSLESHVDLLHPLPLSAVHVCCAQAPALGIAPEEVEAGSDLEKLLTAEGGILRLKVMPEAKPVASGAALAGADDDEEEEAPPSVSDRQQAKPQQQTTLDRHMQPGPFFDSSPMPFNLDASMSGPKIMGVAQPANAQQQVKRGCHRAAERENATPQQPLAAAAPAKKASPALGKKRAAPAAAKPAAAAKTAPAKKPKQRQQEPPPHPPASAATVAKYKGKIVRVPHEWFPREARPANGYWLATVGRFADAKQTVWLKVDGEDPFWRYSHELETLELHA